MQSLLNLKSLLELFRYLAKGTVWGLLLGLLFLGTTIWAVHNYMQININDPRLLTARELRNYETLSPLEMVLVDGSITGNSYQRVEAGVPVHYALLTTAGGSFVVMSETPFVELGMPLNGRFESKTAPQFMQIREILWNQSTLDTLPLTFFVVGDVPYTNIVIYALTGFICSSLAMLGIGSFVLKKLGKLPQ